MADDFRDFLAALVNAGVRFLVVGAHAMAAHGVPRTTGDMDVLVEPNVENAARVWHALGIFGAPLQSLNVTQADFSKPDVVVQLGLPPYRIDVLTSISGVTFDEAWGDRLDGEMQGVPVSFLGRESFIRNKRATGRRKDLLDIELLG